MQWPRKAIRYCNEVRHLSIEARFSVPLYSTLLNTRKKDRWSNSLNNVHSADITNYSKGNDTSDFMKASYFRWRRTACGSNFRCKYLTCEGRWKANKDRTESTSFDEVNQSSLPNDRSGNTNITWKNISTL